MPIYESARNYITGQVLILWDNERPSDDDFLDYAKEHYGISGHLSVEDPVEFRGMINCGTAIITPVKQMETKELEANNHE